MNQPPSPTPSTGAHSPSAQRRALVTGATGFLGSHLVGHLLRANWTVAALTRRPPPPALAPVQLYPYTGQTGEVLHAIAAFQPDVVFHLASLFLAEHTSAQLQPLLAANLVLGTQLLEAMHAAGVPTLINAGTSWQNAGGPAYHPANLYAATKQAFEAILAYYVERAGLTAVTLRLYDTYGPADPRPKLIPLLLRTLRTGEPLAMSPGYQLLDLVHVDDVCRAFLHAAPSSARPSLVPHHHVYAVSSNERRTLRQVVATLEAAAGRHLPVTFGGRPYRHGEIMTPWEGPPLPGWAPTIPLAEGLGQLLALKDLA